MNPGQLYRANFSTSAVYASMDQFNYAKVGSIRVGDCCLFLGSVFCEAGVEYHHVLTPTSVGYIVGTNNPTSWTPL